MKQFLRHAGFLLLLLPHPALAQVTVNQAALQQLAGISAPPPVIEALPAAPAVHHRRHFIHLAIGSPKPVVPEQVAAHVVAPRFAPRVATPVTQKPLSPLAPPAAKPAAPVALVFAPGSADLPANAGMALHPFCAAPGRVAIDARAPTDPSDPSAAMRLSLMRAIAIQQALTSCGVPGQNVIPRALGDVPGANEDETVVGAGLGAKN